MNKKTNKNLFKNAGYSIVVTAVVVAVVILLNVLVSAIPEQYTRFDLTKTGLYTATSEETAKCLAELDQDLIVYYLCAAGEEDITVKTFMENYVALSDHISMKNIDPVVYPNFFANYGIETLTSNTVIVVNENLTDDEGKPLYFVINGGTSSTTDTTEGLSEFYGWSMDANAYYTTGAILYYPATFVGEQQMATAINYVTNTVWPQVYVLSGHGEEDLTYLHDAISNNIIQFNTLLLGDSIPEDCEMIIVHNPKFDLTDAEYELLSQYLNQGNDMLFMMTHSKESDLANFNKLFESYGFSIDNEHYIMELSNAHLLSAQYPYIFVPTLGEDSAFATINKNNLYVYSYYALPISETSSHRSSITFNPICFTNTGYLATWEGDEYDNTSTSKYISGAHIVEAYDEVETNIYIFTGIFVDGPYNYMVLSDILKESCNVELTVEIESVDLAYDQLSILESEANLWGSIVQIVIPATVLLAGVIVFIIRRRK